MTRDDLAEGHGGYALEWLVLERSVSNNTVAGGRQCQPDDDRLRTHAEDLSDLKTRRPLYCGVPP